MIHCRKTCSARGEFKYHRDESMQYRSENFQKRSLVDGECGRCHFPFHAVGKAQRERAMTLLIEKTVWCTEYQKILEIS